MYEQNHTFEKWWSKADVADAIVVDLDGTLINTDLANFLSYEAAISRIVSTEFYLTFDPNNRLTRETIKNIFPAISVSKLTQVVAEKERVYCNFLFKSKLNMKITKILERATDKTLILATNSRKKRADMLLAHHGLTKRFTHILYRDDIDKRDKYQRLLLEICVNKESIVVFEDDVDEINRAIAAGINSEFVINVRDSW